MTPGQRYLTNWGNLKSKAKKRPPTSEDGRCLGEQAAKSDGFMITQNQQQIKRVSIFVDGNNLYYGIFDMGWHDLLWPDLHALGSLVVSKGVQDTTVNSVKHFTARPREVEGSKLNPAVWVSYTRSNEVFGGVETIQGRFVRRDRGRLFEEKETDANLAAHLCIDAAKGRFDEAVVVTADTDFIGTFRYLKEQLPHIGIVLGLPPKPHGIRQSRKLVRESDAHVAITRGMLERCQLPEEVADPATGRIFRRPTVASRPMEHPQA